MSYLILLCIFIVVLFLHVEIDKMQKALVEKIEDAIDDYKRESASRSVDDYYNA